MNAKAVIATVLLSGGLVSACASLETNAVQIETVTIKTEDTLSTGIESVRLWMQEDGATLLTGRILQRGYGRLITGHIDIQLYPQSGKSMRQYTANLRFGRKPAKTRKVGYFEADLGTLDAVGSTVRLSYHDGAHDEPLKLLKGA